MKGNRVILSGHCGDKKRFPQNVMEGFISAVKFGVDMIETDIRMCCDGELVLIHDTNAERTCGVDLDITRATLAEIKKLNKAHYLKDPEIHMEIPTVRELMEYVKDKDVLVNWEIKIWPQPMGEWAFTVADKLIELIEEYGLGNRSMISCFNNPVLEYIYKKHGKKYPLHAMGVGGCRRTLDHTELPQEVYVDWACMYADHSCSSPLGHREHFDYAIANGIIPCVCIPDDEESYREVLSYGCKMFTSTDIYEADRILRKLGVR